MSNDYVVFNIPFLNTRGRVGTDGILQIEQVLQSTNGWEAPGQNIDKTKKGWAWVYVATNDGRHVPFKFDEINSYPYNKETREVMQEAWRNYLAALGDIHPVNLF